MPHEIDPTTGLPSIHDPVTPGTGPPATNGIPNVPGISGGGRDQTNKDIVSIIQYVIQYGLDAAKERFAITDGDLRNVLNNAGLSGEQMTLLQEGRDFRETFKGPSGATPATSEIWRLGRKLVTNSGFTPEFRDAWDKLLDSGNR